MLRTHDVNGNRTACGNLQHHAPPAPKDMILAIFRVGLHILLQHFQQTKDYDQDWNSQAPVDQWPQQLQIHVPMSFENMYQLFAPISYLDAIRYVCDMLGHDSRSTAFLCHLD